MLDLTKLTKPYLIAEIGINHNGNIQIAKKLIDATFACSWDCAKFQKRNPDKAVPEHQKNVEKDTPWGKMTYLEYKHRVEFGKKEYDYIDKYCKEKPIDWTASVWDYDSLDFLTKYDLPFIKVPSAMLTNDSLLTETSKSGFPVILSTGMSTIEEIDHAFEILSKYTKSYALLHTNSSYPAKSEDLNLNSIPFLIERYKCTIGYSGHEYGLTPTVIAIALGAKIIERHITIDRHLWGTDQLASVEIEGMDSLSKRVSEVRTILGVKSKIVTESELSIRKKLRGV